MPELMLISLMVVKRAFRTLYKIKCFWSTFQWTTKSKYALKILVSFCRQRIVDNVAIYEAQLTQKTLLNQFKPIAKCK